MFEGINQFINLKTGVDQGECCESIYWWSTLVTPKPHNLSPCFLLCVCLLYMFIKQTIRDASVYPLIFFRFLILVYFLSQINYMACHSNLFYQILGRPNDKKVGLVICVSHHTSSTLTLNTWTAMHAGRYTWPCGGRTVYAGRSNRSTTEAPSVRVAQHRQRDSHAASRW